jgi:uncharacterized protein
MEYRIITSENFTIKNWSGGTTTELFIFPATADYQQRNFQFRLSKSTIETDKSDFTTLPGFSRKLMVLSGEISISHERHHSRILKKFETDEFEGDWKTSSVGKCTDFNLMTTGEITGDLTSIIIGEKQRVDYKIRNNCDWLFMYIHSGKISIEINMGISTARKGDLFALYKPSMVSLEIKGLEYTELVCSEIYF